MQNSGSCLSTSSNKWHSTATHTSSSIAATRSQRRPSIPLSEISTNVNTAAAATALTTISTKCVYVKEVISFNNSMTHHPLASSDGGSTSNSASECESGELSSDEYPSQIKCIPLPGLVVKPQSAHNHNNNVDSTHEMGTLAQLLNHSPLQIDSSYSSQKHRSDIHRHEVPEHKMRSSSSSSTPRIEPPCSSPRRHRRLSQHLSTTIQRQKTRNEQRLSAYAQLKHIAERRLNVVAELVTLDEQYEATLAQLLLPGSNAKNN